MPTHFSVIRYVPDPVRGERINIGVVVFDGAGRIWFRFLRDWTRVQAFATADVVGELQRFGREFEGWTAENIRVAATSHHHSIQFTPPAGSLLDGETLLAQSAERFLVEPAG